MPRLPSTIAHSMPAGPGADDEHVVVGVLGAVELLRVPAAAVLLARGGVLGADRAAGRRSPSGRCRRCSRCTRGCRRAGLPRSSSAGTGRRSTGRQVAMMSRQPESIASTIMFGVDEAADAEHRLLRDLLDPLLPGALVVPRGRSARASASSPHSAMPETLMSQTSTSVVDELDERSAVSLELRCRARP